MCRPRFFIIDPPFNPHHLHGVMLSWALVFFIIAIIAGILGFTGIAGAAASIAQILFFLFLVLFVLLLVFGRRPPPA